MYPGLNSNVASAMVHLAASGALVLGVDFAWYTFETRRYLRLRWKSWSGPSRTGIPPAMVTYIGDSGDWAALLASAGYIQQHPVERFAGFSLCKSKGRVEDPTDLLRSRVHLDQVGSSLWIPQSQERLGVYQPIVSDQSASLLWGEHLGFQRRCSRGVISIPPNLLMSSPTLKSGLMGNAVCLAYGILARNKGLEPATLICNLKAKGSFRVWEECGCWPHPAKTLRTFYYAEFNQAFSLLGESYVTAATELAVLLADIDPALISEWLDSRFEHQDLAFNLDAHALGASQEDLQRIYRGHYAAMLISLSGYRKGTRVRPELTVFDAVCRLENAPLPSWASSDGMNARREGELDAYGPSLEHLIDSII
ncbi:hypothetical protein FGG08_006480 [Glutinoglossum americanum]|uniref:Uncharacterized protein n=1 Tax=Glutinoglossum americanum TaxID=1670608 RepID=A0A9P8L0B6_9PEZI|nr:hypothetical protein FGG08_006480 [Glutinoglossum americanum]